MTVIRPMRPESFAAYKAAEVASFAEENVTCGRWPADGAHERSLREFDELLPVGLATPNNHLFEILERSEGQAVGHLWFAVEERGDQQVAFIYDIEIDERHRRLGHAQRALIELESLVRSLGLSRVSLHVSGQNPHAQALYGKLGFGVMGVSMSKPLPNEPHSPPVLSTTPVRLSEALPGTWRLLSRVDVDASGERKPEPSLGDDPIALLMYDRAGHFAAQFMRRDRSSAIPDELASGSNNSRAQGGYDAYFGTYTVDDDRGMVTQRLLASLSQENVGMVLTRAMEVAEDRLVIKLETSARDGAAITRTLIWQRVG